jgi:hypothetical protein
MVFARNPYAVSDALSFMQALTLKKLVEMKVVFCLSTVLGVVGHSVAFVWHIRVLMETMKEMVGHKARGVGEKAQSIQGLRNV